MPKQNAKTGIRLDLLRPQSNPEKLPVLLFKWLLKSGRYVFIFVEAIVLIAFIARFKLDADIQSRKEAIDAQIPYIESLKPYEVLIRETQLKLSTIAGMRQTQADYPGLLKGISDQTPFGIKITNLSINKQVGKIDITLSGQASNNNDISAFIAGLKSNGIFSNVTLASVGIETGTLQFSANLTAKTGPLSQQTNNKSL